MTLFCFEKTAVRLILRKLSSPDSFQMCPLSCTGFLSLRASSLAGLRGSGAPGLPGVGGGEGESPHPRRNPIARELARRLWFSLSRQQSRQLEKK